MMDAIFEREEDVQIDGRSIDAAFNEDLVTLLPGRSESQMSMPHRSYSENF